MIFFEGDNLFKDFDGNVSGPLQFVWGGKLDFRKWENTKRKSRPTGSAKTRAFTSNPRLMIYYWEGEAGRVAPIEHEDESEMDNSVILKNTERIRQRKKESELETKYKRKME